MHEYSIYPDNVIVYNIINHSNKEKIISTGGKHLNIIDIESGNVTTRLDN